MRRLDHATSSAPNEASLSRPVGFAGLHGLGLGYRFLLRTHGVDGSDLSLYALPPGYTCAAVRTDTLRRVRVIAHGRRG